MFTGFEVNQGFLWRLLKGRLFILTHKDLGLCQKEPSVHCKVPGMSGGKVVLKVAAQNQDSNPGRQAFWASGLRTGTIKLVLTAQCTEVSVTSGWLM